eukprot:4596347-Lingulodinium_polyedra.AAC.1
MGREAEFTKRAAPEHLSCKDYFLRRSPFSLARGLAMALRARGEQPSADATRCSGVYQLRH